MRDFLRIDNIIKHQGRSDSIEMIPKSSEKVIFVFLCLLPAFVLSLLTDDFRNELKATEIHKFFSHWYPFIDEFKNHLIEDPSKHITIYSWIIIYSVFSAASSFLISPWKFYCQYFLIMPRVYLLMFIISFAAIISISFIHGDSWISKIILYSNNINFFINSIGIFSSFFFFTVFIICFILYILRFLFGKVDKLGI